MSEAAVRDWIRGEDGVAFQRCAACSHIWYFGRDFCPNCGGRDVPAVQAAGRGTVYALSLVTRAPSQELRALAPYCVVLVDAVEGFRMMAHGDNALRIGDPVQARFMRFGELTVPYLEKSA